MTLDLSLGEFAALTAKAFRGVGYPWGLASDGAHAARVLAQNAMPAADIVARLLVHVDAAGFGSVALDSSSAETAVCPICIGTALADLGDAAVDRADELLADRMVFEPLLLLPFLRDASVLWPEGRASMRADGLKLAGAPPPGSARVRIARGGPDDAAAIAQCTRALVDRATYDALEQLAMRTYAPASAASRAGAGAGTSDND